MRYSIIDDTFVRKFGVQRSSDDDDDRDSCDEEEPIRDRTATSPIHAKPITFRPAAEHHNQNGIFYHYVHVALATHSLITRGATDGQSTQSVKKGRERREWLLMLSI